MEQSHSDAVDRSGPVAAKAQPWAYAGKLLWLFRYVGWYRALTVCAAKPFDILTKPFTRGEWFWQFAEAQFDARHGVDTFDIVPVAKLDISAARKAEAVLYEPVPIMEFGYVISRLSVSYSDYALVDIGSGKGRVLLLAAWFPLKQIVGVELSPTLHQIAESNISRYQGRRNCTDVTSVCADAGDCSFPSGPMILFLFNPFEANVLSLFLENLHRSLLKNQRKVILIYGNPRHRDVIDNTEWLVQIGTELDDWYLIYEANTTTHPAWRPA